MKVVYTFEGCSPSDQDWIGSKYPTEGVDGIGVLHGCSPFTFFRTTRVSAANADARSKQRVDIVINDALG